MTVSIFFYSFLKYIYAFDVPLDIYLLYVSSDNLVHDHSNDIFYFSKLIYTACGYISSIYVPTEMLLYHMLSLCYSVSLFIMFSHTHLK